MSLKFGFVTESKPGFAKVEFPEEDLISAFLPVIVQQSRDNKAAHTLDINTHVCCVMDKHSENGVILGAIYSERDTVPADLDNSDIEGKVFSD